MSGNRSKSAFYKGGGSFGKYFKGKGASLTGQCWCRKTRVIAVSCGIKIFAVRCLVLSQYTRMTDGQTNRRTDRIATCKSHDKNEDDVDESHKHQPIIYDFKAEILETGSRSWY